MRLPPIMEKFSPHPGKESGVTLIETLVALAILCMIVPAFIGGLGTAAKATIIADEQATAETLAKGEIECVKSQDYIYSGQGMYQNREQSHGFVMPTGYSVDITVTPIDPDTGQQVNPEQDAGIQQITVTVNRNSEPVLEIKDYKVDR